MQKSLVNAEWLRVEARMAEQVKQLRAGRNTFFVKVAERGLADERG